MIVLAYIVHDVNYIFCTNYPASFDKTAIDPHTIDKGKQPVELFTDWNFQQRTSH